MRELVNGSKDVISLAFVYFVIIEKYGDKPSCLPDPLDSVISSCAIHMAICI